MNDPKDSLEAARIENREDEARDDAVAALSQVGPKARRPVPGANNGKSPKPPAQANLHRVVRPVFIYGRMYSPGAVIPYDGPANKRGALVPVDPPKDKGPRR